MCLFRRAKLQNNYEPRITNDIKIQKTATYLAITAFFYTFGYAELTLHSEKLK
jgi:hypothetical protein